ncbi:MAG: bacillithiol system redox-active protein YtxJ [Chitinophagales bacterium]|nr:bacillithiol system redox-active protein YtxJ [Chitinophagales bacterium]
MKEIQTITTIEEVDEIISRSKVKSQVIFKHSTVCPISRMSYEKMKAEYPLSEDAADIYYVGVIEQRPISNYIAEKLQVKHESPQMIVLRDGKSIFNESHLMIDPKILLSL